MIPQTTQVTIRDAVRAALAGTPTPTPAPKPAPTPTTPVLGLAAAGLYDVNAAKNVLAAGLAVSVCGDGRSLRHAHS